MAEDPQNWQDVLEAAIPPDEIDGAGRPGVRDFARRMENERQRIVAEAAEIVLDNVDDLNTLTGLAAAGAAIDRLARDLDRVTAELDAARAELREAVAMGAELRAGLEDVQAMQKALEALAQSVQVEGETYKALIEVEWSEDSMRLTGRPIVRSFQVIEQHG